MAISPEQYTFLIKKQRLELADVALIAKAEAIATYLDQAEIVNGIIGGLTEQILTDEQKLINFFAINSNIFDDLNSDFYKSLSASQLELIRLGYDHTAEYSFLNGKPLTNFFINPTLIDNLKIPDDLDGFDLSKALWGDTNKKDLLQLIINANNSGIKLDELYQLIERYLGIIDQNASGGYAYKARRLVDTELQRAYSRASIDSTRKYNAEYGKDFGILYWRRQTSPAHKHTDICDSLAGVYDSEGKVPSVPSHANCICLISRVFASDYKGDVRRYSGDIYTDSKTKTSQKLV